MKASLHFISGMVSFGTCCVIGGKGWTGSYLTKHLINIKRNKTLNQQYNINSIHVIDLINDKFNNIIRRDDDSLLYVTHHTCDITNFKHINRLLCVINPTVIYHLASIIDLRKYPSELLERVNVQGTWNILYTLINSLDDDIDRYLIYTSSIDVASTKVYIMHARLMNTQVEILFLLTIIKEQRSLRSSYVSP